MKHSITCKQAIDYISKKEEGKISTWKRVRLWQHLATCDLCRRFSAQSKLLARFISIQTHKQQHHLLENQKQAIIERVFGQDLK